MPRGLYRYNIMVNNVIVSIIGLGNVNIFYFYLPFIRLRNLIKLWGLLLNASVWISIITVNKIKYAICETFKLILESSASAEYLPSRWLVNFPIGSMGGALVFLVPTPLDLLGLVPSGISGAHRRGPVGWWSMGVRETPLYLSFCITVCSVAIRYPRRSPDQYPS